jgi:hypothetical protein
MMTWSKTIQKSFHSLMNKILMIVGVLVIFSLSFVIWPRCCLTCLDGLWHLIVICVTCDDKYNSTWGHKCWILVWLIVMDLVEKYFPSLSNLRHFMFMPFFFSTIALKLNKWLNTCVLIKHELTTYRLTKF